MTTQNDQGQKPARAKPEKTEGAKRPAVFAGLQSVMDEVSKVGVAKSRRNTKQGYDFRGIDDAMNAFSGPLARAKLILTPQHTLLKQWEIETNSGGRLPVVMFETMLKFLSTVDGSEYTAGPFYGEASDVLDKASTKGQSVALRTALFQVFCVPFGPEMDPEHESDDEAGESDLHRGKVPAGEEVRSPKTAMAEGADPHVGLSDGQVRILTAKMGLAKVEFAELNGEVGQINPTNFRSAVKYLESKA